MTYLCHSVVWSAAWFGAGVLCTLTIQRVLNLWRHQ